MRKPVGLMSVVVAVAGVVTGLLSMYSLVPRVRLVEALTLFATAFAAGAGFAATIASLRANSK